MLTRRSDERTWATSDIVECEFGHTRVEFHQQGQRLADTSAGTEDSDLSQLEAQRCQQRSTEVAQDNGESKRTCDADAEKARRCAKPLLKTCLAANILTDYERNIEEQRRCVGWWWMDFCDEVWFWTRALEVLGALVHGPSQSFTQLNQSSRASQFIS